MTLFLKNRRSATKFWLPYIFALFSLTALNACGGGSDSPADSDSPASQEDSTQDDDEYGSGNGDTVVLSDEDWDAAALLGS